MTVQHSKFKNSYFVFNIQNLKILILYFKNLKHFESELNKYSLEIRLNEVDFDFKSIVL